MYIDTHCHVNFDEFRTDISLVITNAQKVGVKKFIIPGASIATSQSAISLVKMYPDCMKASLGCHPYETTRYPDIKIIEKLIDASVSAIGECGLDYHPYKGYPAIGKKDEQKQLFEAHLLLAIKHNLPVIIHCRDAYEDIFSVLDALPSIPKGVFHCFSGGLADYREATKRGFYIGLDGNITYSKQLQTIIPSMELSSLLLETDAPYLTPIPHRGKRNEPKYIPLIAKTLAQLLTITIEEVADITTKNAQALFAL